MKGIRQARWMEPIIFEIGNRGRRGYSLPKKIESEHAPKNSIPEHMKRKVDPNLPELSEVEVVRHFTRLSQMNFGVDSGFYPLGSCTMKYNPMYLI